MTSKGSLTCYRGEHANHIGGSWGHVLGSSQETHRKGESPFLGKGLLETS
jgi:hypothetical protein